MNRMKSTERRRELIPQVRSFLSKRAVGDLSRGSCRWSSYVATDEERVLHVD